MFESILKYNKLCDKRRHHSFWADNIMEAEQLCKSDEERKHFMSYIMNPKTYDAEAVKDIITLGDLEDMKQLRDERKPLPDMLEEERYTNGNECLVIAKFKGGEEEHDEKKPEY